MHEMFEVFSLPYEMMCKGTRANGLGQPSCMVCQEWLTRVHHSLSSNIHILDTAPPLAMGTNRDPSDHQALHDTLSNCVSITQEFKGNQRFIVMNV